jgi:hypothetical protein
VHLHSDLTQLRKVALRAVCSEMLEPTKSKAVIWFFRSSRHGCKVRKYKKSAHHVTPILESTSHGHSSHTKLKSTHNDCNTVVPLYFIFFFFRPFQHPEPCAPCPTSTAENSSYPTANKNYLLLPRDLECDQAYLYLIVLMIPMTGPCLILLP